MIIDNEKKELWQWDTGQTLRLEEAEKAQNITAVSFSTDNRQAVLQPVAEGAVQIPDSMLQVSGALQVFLHCYVGNTMTTLTQASYFVRSQPKPDDYAIPEEVPTWHRLEERITALEQGNGNGLPPIGPEDEGKVPTAAGGQYILHTPGGATAEQAAALDEMLKLCAYIRPDVEKEYAAFRKAFGLSASVPAEKISLSAENLTFTDTAPQMLTAALQPPDASDSVVWSSKNENVAIVSQNGEVRPVNNGCATITATAGKASASCSVHVNLADAKTFTIEYKLTNCRSTNGAQDAAEKSRYETTLTANAGYTMDGAAVTVMMGGADITGAAYSGGTVLIPSVTGSVTITAAAAVPAQKKPFGVSWKSGKLLGNAVQDNPNYVQSDFFDAVGKSCIRYNTKATLYGQRELLLTWYDKDKKVIEVIRLTSNANPDSAGFDPELTADIPEGTVYIKASTQKGVPGADSTVVPYDDPRIIYELR